MDSARYWRQPNSIQTQVNKITRRSLALLPERITAATAIYAPTGGYMPRYKVERLHRLIDRWKDRYGYWDSQDLAMKAQYFRRREKIKDDDGFALVLLALFVENFHDMALEVQPYYERVFRNKYRYATGSDYTLDTLPYNWSETVLPIGISMLALLYEQAAFRARRQAKTISGLIDEPDFAGGDEPLVRQELQRTHNALIKQSSGGGWHGILDTIMAFCIGYAMWESAKVVPYTKFEFNAVLDERTTDSCMGLDGRIFPKEKMKLGINTPPIINPPHPCRSWIEWIK